MSYIVVRQPYGPPIAHQSGCRTLRKDRPEDTFLPTVPPGAVICSHCHPVPAEVRDADWEEDGFIIIRDPHHKGKAIAHHPLCRTLTSKHMGGARWNHHRVSEIPKSATVCRHCRAKPPKARHVTPAGRFLVSTPVGEYFLQRRSNGKPLLIPLACPVCKSAAVDRIEESARRWFCYQCDWEGAVYAKTWTLVERTVAAPTSTQGGAGRANAQFVTERIISGRQYTT